MFRDTADELHLRPAPMIQPDTRDLKSRDTLLVIRCDRKDSSKSCELFGHAVIALHDSFVLFITLFFHVVIHPSDDPRSNFGA